MASKRKELPDLSPRGISPDEHHTAPTPEQARALAVRHGFPPKFELFERLDDCWFWWRVAVESGPPPTGRARRDFLRELSHRAERLADAIPKMAGPDQRTILEAAPHLDLEALAGAMRDLSSASREAIPKVRPSKAGARGRPDEIELLSKLWRIYRDAIGPDAARITRVGTIFSGKFYDFAADVLRLFGVHKPKNQSLGKNIQKAQKAVAARDAKSRMP